MINKLKKKKTLIKLELTKEYLLNKILKKKKKYLKMKLKTKNKKIEKMLSTCQMYV